MRSLARVVGSAPRHRSSRVGDVAAFGQFHVGVGPGHHRVLSVLANCDIDHGRLGRRLPQLRTRLALNLRLHRHARFSQGIDRFLNIVERLDSVRIDQRREVIDVVPVHRHPGRVLAFVVQCRHAVFLGSVPG